MKKNTYIRPCADIVTVEAEDIIVTSGKTLKTSIQGLDATQLENLGTKPYDDIINLK